MRIRVSGKPKTFKGTVIYGSPWEWRIGSGNIKTTGFGAAQVRDVSDWTPFPAIPYIHVEGECDYENVEVDLVPFPFMETPVERGMIVMKDLWYKEFMQCVKGWRGLTDEDTGEEIPCTEDNKHKVFNTNQPFRQFVIKCIEEMGGADTDILKN